MYKIVVLAGILCIAACAEGPLTPEEEYAKRDRYNQTVLEYQICRQVYQQRGIIWFSDTHHPRGKLPPALEMRKEMAHNGCRFRRPK